MKKRQFSPEYKSKLVLESLKEEKTLSEIAAREGISRVQLQNWKKEFLENAVPALKTAIAQADAKRQQMK